ncbi:hypothetical protein BFV93_1004 [Alteromonas macleodii]|nr:hypothetical protein BFV93_1004 [Alteromonas macleodii]
MRPIDLMAMKPHQLALFSHTLLYKAGALHSAVRQKPPEVCGATY